MLLLWQHKLGTIRCLDVQIRIEHIICTFFWSYMTLHSLSPSLSLYLSPLSLSVISLCLHNFVEKGWKQFAGIEKRCLGSERSVFIDSVWKHL